MNQIKSQALSVPKGYKQTEVGVIPEDWQVKPLYSFAHVYSGGTPKTEIREYYNGHINFISSGDLNQGFIQHSSNTITQSGFDNSSAQVVEPGTFLIAMYGATAGVCAITNISAAINQAVLAVIPSSGKNEYLFYWWSLNKEEIVRKLTQGGQPNLSGKIIKLVQIPLPPLPEQTAIASALSDMDALIAQTERLIEKKKAIKQGAMQELLEPREGWVTKKLGEVFTFYPTANFSKAEMSLQGDVGCLHYGLIHAIDNTSYSLSNGVKYFVTTKQATYERIIDGDVIMVDASEDLIGLNKSIEVCDVGSKQLIPGLHTFHLRDQRKEFVDGVRGLVLSSSFVKNQLLKLAVGMKVYGVSKPQLMQVAIPIPTREEQTRMSSVIACMDDEITFLVTKLHKLKLQKQGMMQALLTGKIRLV